MHQLNDKNIRVALIQYLISSGVSSDEIFQELHVHNGRAIADVVSLKVEPHCYEIKGDGDKIKRITQQGYFYNQAFRRITVVTTEKHLATAIDIAPDFWGIILVKINEKNLIVLKNIRRSKINNSYEKNVALLSLWKSEMLDLLPIKDKKIERKNRTSLASLIAESKKKKEISRQIAEKLHCRHKFKALSG